MGGYHATTYWTSTFVGQENHDLYFFRDNYASGMADHYGQFVAFEVQRNDEVSATLLNLVILMLLSLRDITMRSYLVNQSGFKTLLLREHIRRH